MVESAQSGDGINRPITYAKWRTDIPTVPGHTAELVSVHLDQKFYDNLDDAPGLYGDCDTLLKHFLRHKNLTPDLDFLGTRTPPKEEKGEFGPYTYLSFAEVDH